MSMFNTGIVIRNMALLQLDFPAKTVSGPGVFDDDDVYLLHNNLDSIMDTVIPSALMSGSNILLNEVYREGMTFEELGNKLVDEMRDALKDDTDKAKHIQIVLRSLVGYAICYRVTKIVDMIGRLNSVDLVQNAAWHLFGWDGDYSWMAVPQKIVNGNIEPDEANPVLQLIVPALNDRYHRLSNGEKSYDEMTMIDFINMKI